jgi:hypothetical protein
MEEAESGRLGLFLKDAAATGTYPSLQDLTAKIIEAYAEVTDNTLGSTFRAFP